MPVSSSSFDAASVPSAFLTSAISSRFISEMTSRIVPRRSLSPDFIAAFMSSVSFWRSMGALLLIGTFTGARRWRQLSRCGKAVIVNHGHRGVWVHRAEPGLSDSAERHPYIDALTS
jgi:hypothetical protein